MTTALTMIFFRDMKRAPFKPARNRLKIGMMMQGILSVLRNRRCDVTKNSPGHAGLSGRALGVINIAHFDFASYIIENPVPDGERAALPAIAVRRAAEATRLIRADPSISFSRRKKQK
ncbi:MAG TPA: hypothetical protein PK843_08545 [bacterium]|nr:hypothetical protein [bacterium]